MKTIAQQLYIKEFPFIIRNDNGNILYHETEKGYWSKYEYDRNNNQTYFKNLSGYWNKAEYDSDNNQIYYEDSNGYIEDNRTVEQFKDRIKQIINLPGDDFTDGQILDMISDIL